MKGGRRWARRIRRRFSAPASGLRYSRVWSIHPPPGMRGDRTDRLRESKPTPSVFRLYTFTSDLLLQTSDFRLQTSDFLCLCPRRQLLPTRVSGEELAVELSHPCQRLADRLRRLLVEPRRGDALVEGAVFHLERFDAVRQGVELPLLVVGQPSARVGRPPFALLTDRPAGCGRAV